MMQKHNVVKSVATGPGDIQTNKGNSMKRDEKAPEYLTIEIKSPSETWGMLHAIPRDFNTGSVGYFGVGKISNPENPIARYQFNFNITLIGSKSKS